MTPRIRYTAPEIPQAVKTDIGDHQRTGTCECEVSAQYFFLCDFHAGVVEGYRLKEAGE